MTSFSNLMPYAVYYNSVPTAYIVVGDIRLKTCFGNKLYFKNNQEFKIELYNPKTINVLAKIYINDENASTIVIRPGQHIYLDKYLDNLRKFKFETYSVKNTADNIVTNIRIEFYDEKIPVSSSTVELNGNTLVRDIIYNTQVDDDTYYINLLDNVNSTLDIDLNIDSVKKESSIVKKEKTNQELVVDNLNFYSHTTVIIEYQILPESEFNKFRQYCSCCYHRIKKISWEFCPICGNKL